jgi:exopolyphosphatase/guanosine-5'-triphosphate,3'-diphosphate pyrophosphatase
MSPVFQKKTCMLAAILRIADGLDYLHNASVQEVHCVISSDHVTCDVVGTGELSIEKERVRSKADLFIQAFERELVIR